MHKPVGARIARPLKPDKIFRNNTEVVPYACTNFALSRKGELCSPADGQGCPSLRAYQIYFV